MRLRAAVLKKVTLQIVTLYAFAGCSVVYVSPGTCER